MLSIFNTVFKSLKERILLFIIIGQNQQHSRLWTFWGWDGFICFISRVSGMAPTRNAWRMNHSWYVTLLTRRACQHLIAYIRKDRCTAMFMAALFTIAKTWKQPIICLTWTDNNLSINRWMDKEDVVHIYNGILLSHRKEWNNAICSNMGEPRDYRTKRSKSDRETQISLWYHLYVESKTMIQMNLFIRHKRTHRLRKQTYGYQRWGGEG